MKVQALAFLTVALCQSAFAILDGQNATIEEFPYIVAIKFRGVLACAGAIIDSRHIVTGDNCLSGKPVNYLTVQAGSTLLHDDPSAVTVGVEKSYTAGSTDFRRHMEVLKLSEELKFSEKIQPIELAPQDADVPEQLTTAGWGSYYLVDMQVYEKPGPYSPNLRSLSVNSYSRADCRDMLDYTGKYLFENSESCAFNPDMSKSACDGDGGAPLVGADGQLYGVYNWINDCRPPQIYSSIPYFHDWIVEQTQK